MTLQDDIDTIYKLDKERTQGDWWSTLLDSDHPNENKKRCVFKANAYVGQAVSAKGKTDVCLLPNEVGERKPNADFIAAAPLMVSIIRRLEAKIGIMQDLLEDWHNNWCESDRNINELELYSKTQNVIYGE